MSCLVKEFTLSDLLADPVIGLVMKSDGVEPDCVERLFASIAERAPIVDSDAIAPCV